MRFVSTRGESQHLDFSDVVLGGLATDGGLAMPENMPKIDENTLKLWKELNYTDLAFNVISLFAQDIPAEDLKKLLMQHIQKKNSVLKRLYLFLL